MLTHSLELKIVCENIEFVLNDKYTEHISARLLIDHNLTHLNSGEFHGHEYIYWITAIKDRNNLMFLLTFKFGLNFISFCIQVQINSVIKHMHMLIIIQNGIQKEILGLMRTVSQNIKVCPRGLLTPFSALYIQYLHKVMKCIVP